MLFQGYEAPRLGPNMAISNREQFVTATVDVPTSVDLVAVLGPSDKVLRIIEKGFPQVDIIAYGRRISIAGPTGQVPVVQSLLEELIGVAEAGNPLDVEGVKRAVSLLQTSPDVGSGSTVGHRGHLVRAKTPGQQSYMDALERSQVVFGIGPAGTGKTYLAIARAVTSLLDGSVRRVVLTRPAVEAGENLGFLPGSLTEKIDPYLRPLYDALQELLEEGALPKLLESGAIEIAPIAYMRGRTLNDAYIIVDEAQNTTPAQMKMLLTRLGRGSQMVVTGDVTQIDLGRDQKSGLVQAEEVLRNVGGIEMCYLTSADVVRTQIVADIVDAYQDWEAKHARMVDRDEKGHRRSRDKNGRDRGRSTGFSR